MSLVHIHRLESLQQRVGDELAVSDWVTIDQARIDQCAQATGDHQWIHVDRERAARGPFGTTIAHGYLTLSLIPHLAEQALCFDDVRMSINYGLNRVRFAAPVKVGSRIRARFVLAAVDDIEGGAQMQWQATVEIEGGEKPACIAEMLTRWYL